MEKLWNNRNEYYVIEMKEVSTDKLNIFEIWVEYCKICAFTRVYLVLAKKKISLYNMLIGFLIIFFGIPIKILKLFYFFLVNDKSFREGLEVLFYKNFFLVKGRKIEILNNNVLLNCYTIRKLLK